jgi:hypothetical protein
MVLDERWDQVSDQAWKDFALAWLRQHREGQRERERDEGLYVVHMNFTARPEHKWKFILLAVQHAQSDAELGHVAAGPLEHLLSWHGDAFIAAVEEEAKRDPKFARTMTGVWRMKMSDEIWERVQSIQRHAEPLRRSKGE